MFRRAVPCPACGYDLRAQLTGEGARCSECGTWTPLDQIDDPFARPQVRRIGGWLGVMVVAPGFCIVAAAFLLKSFGVDSVWAGACLAAIVALSIVETTFLSFRYAWLINLDQSVGNRIGGGILIAFIALAMNLGVTITVAVVGGAVFGF